MKLTRPSKIHLVLILVLHFLIFLGLYLEGLEPASKDRSLTPKIVEIERGEGLLRIAQKLYAEGLIKNRIVFIIEARRKGVYRNFQAGEYAFYPYLTLDEIFDMLVKGRVHLHRVTIPEGATLWQIAEILEENQVCDREDFLRWAEDPSLLKELKVPSHTAEGFLFPDTYFFPKKASCQMVISAMVKNFYDQWKTLKDLASASSLSLKEVVILASIVEREAFFEDEKPIIAAVYLNRIKKGMLLQADPTINYALKDFRRLTYRDYRRVKSPYNTYLHRDLPPTPIGNPGLSSLKAVLKPAKVPYLFFVADGSGRHLFSITYDEHRRNINKLRSKRPLDGSHKDQERSFAKGQNSEISL